MSSRVTGVHQRRSVAECDRSAWPRTVADNSQGKHTVAPRARPADPYLVPRFVPAFAAAGHRRVCAPLILDSRQHGGGRAAVALALPPSGNVGRTTCTVGANPLTLCCTLAIGWLRGRRAARPLRVNLREEGGQGAVSTLTVPTSAGSSREGAAWVPGGHGMRQPCCWSPA